MNDHGKPQVGRQLNLSGKGDLLLGRRYRRSDIVQPDLSDGHNLWLARQASKLREGDVIKSRGVLRMDANRGED